MSAGPTQLPQRRESSDDLRTWLHHCEESGNFSGASRALAELEKRGQDPLRYDDPPKDFR